MSGDNLFQNFFFVVFFAIVAFIGFRLVKYRGLKGAVFGARVLHTVGELEPPSTMGFMKTRLKIHVLDSDVTDRAIGVEQITSSVGSWQMTGFTLSVAQAQELIGLLQLAISQQTHEGL